MIWGMSLSTFTQLHVVISLIAIVTGIVVFLGLFSGKRLNGLTAIFLITTVATSVTGFGFPFDHLLPSHKVGILSLVLLTIAILARYAFHLHGAWKRTFVITAGISLYLNCFVLVVQSFQKVPALHALAPHQTEPPFAIAQLIVLIIFAIWIIAATIKFPRRDIASNS